MRLLIHIQPQNTKINLVQDSCPCCFNHIILFKIPDLLYLE